MGESHEIIFAWRNWHKHVHATRRIPPTIPYTSITQGCFAWVTKQDPRATYISADIPKLSHVKFGEVTNVFLKKKATELTPQPCARQFPSRLQQRQKFENSSISLPDTVHAHNAAATGIPVTSHEHSKSHCLASNNTRDKLLLASHNHIAFRRKRAFYIEGSSPLLFKLSSRWHIFCQLAT